MKKIAVPSSVAARYLIGFIWICDFLYCYFFGLTSILLCATTWGTRTQWILVFSTYAKVSRTEFFETLTSIDRYRIHDNTSTVTENVRDVMREDCFCNWKLKYSWILRGSLDLWSTKNERIGIWRNNFFRRYSNEPWIIVIEILFGPRFAYFWCVGYSYRLRAYTIENVNKYALNLRSLKTAKAVAPWHRS